MSFSMKRLNLLNRGIHNLYVCMMLALRICGLNCYVYCSKSNVFIRKRFLTIYSTALYVFNGFVVLIFMLILVKAQKNNCFSANDPCLIRVSVKLVMSLIARFHHFVHEDSFVTLLEELFLILQDIRTLARHPNFFRFSHFVLCLLALQSMLRSIFIQLEPFTHTPTVWKDFLNVWLALLTFLIFNLLVTSVLLIFIGLIACYDELHRCTRRISNDVRNLRMAQCRMECGQRLLLVEQLNAIMEQLITVRARMFNVTVRLIKFFRFHLVFSILYWIGHEIMIFIAHYDDTLMLTFWHVAIGLSNIAFYCTIFEIFVWKSKLSRSFWHMHLIKHNKKFDRTVDKLLHRELVECVRVVAYGIPLNMHLFFKIFMLTIAYTLMRFAYQKP